MDYVDRYFSLSSYPLLASLQVFPTVKDVTEAMGALSAVNDHVDARAVCLAVGDGNTPRCGVLAAFLCKKWRCVTIDPELREEWEGEEPGEWRG